MHSCEETAQAEVETRTDAPPEPTSPAFAGLFLCLSNKLRQCNSELAAAETLALSTQ